jgi:Tol biopolymer transport system component
VQSSPDALNYLTLVKGQETHSVYVPGNRLIDMAWSPDGSTLALSTVTVSDYSGKITENFHTLVTWSDVLKSLYFSEGKVTEKLIWSPDGRSLLLVRRVDSATGYDLNFNLVDISSNAVLPGGFSLTSEQYLGLPAMFWLESAN